MYRPLVPFSLRLLAVAAVLVAVLLPFDPAMSRGAQALPEAIVRFNRAITDFGTFRWMIYGSGLLAVAAYALWRLSRDARIAGRARAGLHLSLYFFVTTGSASALVHLAKFAVGRARPALVAESGAWDLTPLSLDTLFQSFPSGHSAAAGAFFGACAMLAPGLRPFFLLGALAIGVSRVIVGAHYPSDVAAGLLLGFWAAVAVAFLFAGRQWLFRLDVNGWPQPKRPGLDS